MKKILGLLISIVVSCNVLAYENDAYAKAIPYYHYVGDIESLLDKAVQRNRWSLVKNEQGQFNANIVHKGYGIKTQLVIKDNTVSIKLLSAERVGCTKIQKCKLDEDKVQGWLLRLRKSLAYDITLAVRKGLLKESVMTS